MVEMKGDEMTRYKVIVYLAQLYNSYMYGVYAPAKLWLCIYTYDQTLSLEALTACTAHTWCQTGSTEDV